MNIRKISELSYLLLIHQLYLSLFNSLLSKEYSTIFYNPDISCSFQHFLYWLTKVPSLAPLSCRSPEPRAKNTIVNVPVHCQSPYTSCSAVFETDPSATSGYYPVINVEGVVTVVYCTKP